MQAALRPYATAGVALVGASVIAVSPVTVTPSAVDEVRDTAVQLSALTNPIDVLLPILRTALQNAGAVGQSIADDPAPILTQIIANQIRNVAGLPGAIGDQIGVIPQLPQILGDVGENELANLGNITALGEGLLGNIFATLTSTEDGSLQDEIGQAFEAVGDNNLAGAFQALFLAGLLAVAGNGSENLIALGEIGVALAQPLNDAAELLPIAAGPLHNAATVIAALPTSALGVGLGPIVALSDVGTAVGNALSGAITAAQAGDAETVFNDIVAVSTALTDGALNSVVGPTGLLAGLQTFREGIATLITPPASAEETTAAVAKVPAGGAQSFTLTAPLEKTAPKAGPADSAGSGASDVGTVDPGTTKASVDEATPADTKDSVKGGNLFVPGGAAKGGRHRAENGPSFGQELRDAASKTIKGITGLGRHEKSEGAKAGVSGGSGESGSGSSGSGSSNSSGGTN